MMILVACGQSGVDLQADIAIIENAQGVVRRDSRYCVCVIGIWAVPVANRRPDPGLIPGGRRANKSSTQRSNIHIRLVHCVYRCLYSSRQVDMCVSAWYPYPSIRYRAVGHTSSYSRKPSA